MAIDTETLKTTLSTQLKTDYALLAAATVDSRNDLADKLAAAIVSVVVGAIQTQVNDMIGVFNGHVHLSAAPGSPVATTLTLMS